MKAILLFSFIFVTQALSEKAKVISVNKTIHDPNRAKFENCKKIKCPSVSEPLCVKLKYISSPLNTKTIYMVMINRCEMKYFSCYSGVEASKISMVYCDHGKNITSDLKTLMENQRKQTTVVVAGNIQADKEAKKTSDIKAEKKMRFKKEPSSFPKKMKIRHKREAKDDKKVEKKKLRKKEHKYNEKAKKQLFSKKKKHITRQEPSEENDVSSDANLQVYVKDAKNNTKDEKAILGTDAKEDVQAEEDQAENEGDTNDGHLKLHDKKSKQKKKVENDDDDDEDDNDDSVSYREEYQIQTEEEKFDKVDMDQYKAKCPTVCPSRGVMLCARCKDGIYRTFLSECHMRMFDCGHPEEKLSLVSRYPCAMSSPYLKDLRVPQGNIDEPRDEDVVLRFLKCKDYAKKKLKPYSKLNCTFN